MSDPTPTAPTDCDADCDCRLFHELLNGKKLKDRSRRQIRSAIEHIKNHDGAAVVLQAGPGAAGRFDVMYAGSAGIKDVVVSTMATVFPQGQREGRNAGAVLMTREEAEQWLRERFRPELLEAEPEWAETMIELLMTRSRGRRQAS